MKVKIDGSPEKKETNWKLISSKTDHANEKTHKKSGINKMTIEFLLFIYISFGFGFGFGFEALDKIWLFIFFHSTIAFFRQNRNMLKSFSSMHSGRAHQGRRNTINFVLGHLNSSCGFYHQLEIKLSMVKRRVCGCFFFSCFIWIN